MCGRHHTGITDERMELASHASPDDVDFLSWLVGWRIGVHGMYSTLACVVTSILACVRACLLACKSRLRPRTVKTPLDTFVPKLVQLHSSPYSPNPESSSVVKKDDTTAAKKVRHVILGCHLQQPTPTHTSQISVVAR